MFKNRKWMAATAMAFFAVLIATPLVAIATPSTTQTTVDAVGEATVSQAPAEAVAAPGADNQFSKEKWIGLAIGLGMGIAAFGGALGQGRASAAALDGIARNPGASDRIFTPMILGLALIESLVIYSLLISFLLLGKLS